jgi:hypothetical protein
MGCRRAVGDSYPHVIRQLIVQEVTQPSRSAVSICTAIQCKEGQCSFHGRRTGGASIVSNTDACRYACRACEADEVVQMSIFEFCFFQKRTLC